MSLMGCFVLVVPLRGATIPGKVARVGSGLSNEPTRGMLGNRTERCFAHHHLADLQKVGSHNRSVCPHVLDELSKFFQRL